MPFDETPLENTTNAPQQSWLASLIAFIAWLFDAITKLKRVKRTTKFKANWRTHFDGLRETEWHVAQMLAQGAALLLSGKSLDDADYINTPMPADFGGPCPRTPFAMNLRFLAVGNFMRDPERYIRRHAARIAKREHISGCPLRHASRDTSPALRAEEENVSANHRHLSSSDAQRRGRWHATSSSRDGGGSRNRLRIAHARAPPKIPYSQFPNPHSLAARASSEIAPSCPRQKVPRAFQRGAIPLKVCGRGKRDQPSVFGDIAKLTPSWASLSASRQ